MFAKLSFRFILLLSSVCIFYRRFMKFNTTNSAGAQKKTAVHCECQRLDDAQTLLIYLISSYWNFSGFIVIFRSNITHCLWKFPAHRARGNILCPRNRGFKAALIQRQYFAILLSPCSCSCCCHAFSIHLFFLLLRCPSCFYLALSRFTNLLLPLPFSLLWKINGVVCLALTEK